MTTYFRPCLALVTTVLGMVVTGHITNINQVRVVSPNQAALSVEVNEQEGDRQGLPGGLVGGGTRFF